MAGTPSPPSITPTPTPTPDPCSLVNDPNNPEEACYYTKCTTYTGGEGCCDWSYGENKCKECVPRGSAQIDCYGLPAPSPVGGGTAGANIGF